MGSFHNLFSVYEITKIFSYNSFHVYSAYLRKLIPVNKVFCNMAVISLYHAQYGHLCSERILLQSTRRQYKEGIRLAILVQGIKRTTQWYICTNVHFNNKGCVDVVKNQKVCMESVSFPLRIYQHRYNIIVFP